MEQLTMQQTLNLYNRFRAQSDGTVQPVRKYFGLPDCDWCIRMAHKLWAKIMNAHTYKEKKMEALASMELRDLNVMIATIQANDIEALHKQMKKIDTIFDNTH